MKVKKIKIEHELLEIPDDMPYYRELVTPSVAGMILEEGALPKDITTTHTELEYRVREVYDGINKKERYLVRINEDNIFDDLLKLGDEDINYKIDEKVREKIGRMEALYKLKKSSIKTTLENNPLWRRIFKKYN